MKKHLVNFVVVLVAVIALSGCVTKAAPIAVAPVYQPASVVDVPQTVLPEQFSTGTIAQGQTSVATRPKVGPINDELVDTQPVQVVEKTVVVEKPVYIQTSVPVYAPAQLAVSYTKIGHGKALSVSIGSPASSGYGGSRYQEQMLRDQINYERQVARDQQNWERQQMRDARNYQRQLVREAQNRAQQALRDAHNRAQQHGGHRGGHR